MIARACPLPLQAPSWTSMNQTYNLAPRKTSYESSLSALLSNGAGNQQWMMEQPAVRESRLQHSLTMGPVIIVHIITARHSICHADNSIGGFWPGPLFSGRLLSLADAQKCGFRVWGKPVASTRGHVTNIHLMVRHFCRGEKRCYNLSRSHSGVMSRFTPAATE